MRRFTTHHVTNSAGVKRETAEETNRMLAEQTMANRPAREHSQILMGTMGKAMPSEARE